MATMPPSWARAIQRDQSLAVADGFIRAEPGSRFLRRRLSRLCCIDLGFFLPLRLGYRRAVQARQDAAEALRLSQAASFGRSGGQATS